MGSPSLTGAPQTTRKGLAPRLLASVPVRSDIGKVPAPHRTCVRARVRTCACVPLPASARLPRGSRLEAEARVSQIHFLAAHGWGKGHVLFVSPHSHTSLSPGEPNLLEAQNACAAGSGSASTPRTSWHEGSCEFSSWGRRASDAQHYSWRSALLLSALTSEPLGCEGWILSSGQALTVKPYRHRYWYW